MGAADERRTQTAAVVVQIFRWGLCSFVASGSHLGFTDSGALFVFVSRVMIRYSTTTFWQKGFVFPGCSLIRPTIHQIDKETSNRRTLRNSGTNVYIQSSGIQRERSFDPSNSEGEKAMPPTESTPLVLKHDDAESCTESSTGYDSLEGSLQKSMRRLTDSVRRVRDIVVKHTGSIGLLGSMSIAVNSITGPAMLNLPATFARSGVVPTIATLVFVCILSSMCSLHMANTISKIPDNHNFKKEVEFSDAFRSYWGNGWFHATQILFLCCITCLNISSIVDTAQVVDTLLGHWWPGGGSAAVLVGGSECSFLPTDASNPMDRFQWLRWDYSLCSEEDLAGGFCLPFQECDGALLITAGDLATILLFLPLALMDLKENSWWQVVGFVILLVTSCQFIVQFLTFELHPSALTMWGDDWGDLLGVVLFNFALVITIPAWLYEKEPTVDVPTVIYGSNILSVILYISIGLFGCLAMPNVSENMLESMMSGAFGTAMQVSGSIFAFAIVGLGIPLFSVLSRLNLTGSGLCSTPTANFLAVYMPFGASLLLSSGEAVATLLGWGGTIFTSLVAFLLPLALSLHVVRKFDRTGSVSVLFGNCEKHIQVRSLQILMALAVGAIFFAILGNIVQ